MTRLKSIVLCLCALQIVAVPIEYDTTTSESNNYSEIRDHTELSTSNSTDIETTTIEVINTEIQELFKVEDGNATTTDADISANLVKTDVETRFKGDDGDNLEIVTQYSKASLIRDYDEEICDDLIQSEEDTRIKLVNNDLNQFNTSDKPSLLNKPTTYHPRFGLSQSSSLSIFNDVTTTEGTTQLNEVREITTENTITQQTSSEGVPIEEFTVNSSENIPTDQVIGSDVTSSTTLKYEDKTTIPQSQYIFDPISSNQADFGLVTSTTPSNAAVWRDQHFNVPTNRNKNDKHVLSRFGFGTKFNGFSSSFSQPYGGSLSQPEFSTSAIRNDIGSTTIPPPKEVFLNNNVGFNRFSLTPTVDAKLSRTTNFAPIFPVEFSTATIKNDIASTTTPPPKEVYPNNNADFNRFAPTFPIEFSTTTIKNDIASTTIPPPKEVYPNNNADFNRFAPTFPIEFSTTTIKNDIASSTIPPHKEVYPNNNADFNRFAPTFPIEFSTTTIKNDIASTTIPPPKEIFLNNNANFNRFSITPTIDAKLSTTANIAPTFPIEFSTTTIKNDLASTTIPPPKEVFLNNNADFNRFAPTFPIEISTTTIKNDIASTTTPPPKEIFLNNNADFNRFSITPTIDAKLSSSTNFAPTFPIELSTTTIKNDIASTTIPPPKVVFLNNNRFSITPTTDAKLSTTKNFAPKFPFEFSTTTFRNDLNTPRPSPTQPTTPTEFTSTTISELNNFNFAPSSSYADNSITSFSPPTTSVTPKTNVIILNNPSLPQFLTNKPANLNINVNKQYDVFNGIRTLPPQEITSTTSFPIGRKIAVTPRVNIPHPSIELFSKIGDQEARLPPMNRGKINLPGEILPPKFDGRSDTTTEGLVKALFTGKISFGNGTNPESKTGSFYDLQSIQSYNLAFVNSAPTNRFQPIKPRPRTQTFSTTPHKPQVIRTPSGSPQFSLGLIDKYTSANLKIDTVNLGKTGSINRFGDSRRATFFNGLNIYNPSFATFLK